MLSAGAWCLIDLIAAFANAIPFFEIDVINGSPDNLRGWRLSIVEHHDGLILNIVAQQYSPSRTPATMGLPTTKVRAMSAAFKGTLARPVVGGDMRRAPS